MNSYPKLINMTTGNSTIIESDKFSVGRSLMSNFTLQNVFISKKHFVLERTSDGWILRDFSTNGTFVNDKRICYGESQKLENGDIIKFFSFEEYFMFSLPEPSLLDLPQNSNVSEPSPSPLELPPISDGLRTENNYVYDSIDISHPITSSGFDELFNNCLKKRSLLPEVENNPEPKKSKQFGDKKLSLAEEEMQCVICSELFIKAVTLNCCHTFCKYCISKWKKNNSLCPTCRTEIQNMSPTIVLDNYINKLMDELDEETRKSREEIVKEREKEENLEKTPPENSANVSIINLIDTSSFTVSDEVVLDTDANIIHILSSSDEDSDYS